MRGITVQMIALRDLEANPYRHIDQYQIVEEKPVQARLCES